MPTFDRRTFFKSSCLLACMGIASSPGAIAATLSARFTRTLKTALPLAPAEEAVLAFAGQYSSNVRFIGAGALAKLRGAPTHEAHLFVAIDDVEAFHAALAGRLPFQVGFVDGNTFSFVLDGLEFTVENLLPATFATRLTEIVTLKNIAFAQDGLSYDPATRQVTDPFGAEKSIILKLVNRTIAGGAAIGVALRGRVETSRLSLRHGGAFASWQTHNLNLNASPKIAHALVEAFLGKLATIAANSTTDEMKKLLRSRALSSAFNRIFGVKVVDVIAEFDRLRPEISGEFSNAALWLVLLLGPEVESEAIDGAATTWLRRGTRFDIDRSQKALREARLLLTTSHF